LIFWELESSLGCKFEPFFGLQINQVVRQILLHVVYFSYSLLSLVLSLLLLVLLVAFPLLPYQTLFISTHEFSLFSFSPPHLAGGEGKG